MLKDENLDFNNKRDPAMTLTEYSDGNSRRKEETNVAEIPEEIILLSEQRTEAKGIKIINFQMRSEKL